MAAAAARAPGGEENVDVRYIYFGRNTTVMMSSSIFENLLVRLGPRAILVSRDPWRPKAPLVSHLYRRDVKFVQYKTRYILANCIEIFYFFHVFQSYSLDFF